MAKRMPTLPRLLIMMSILLASLGAAATPRAGAVVAARPALTRPQVTQQAATPTPVTTTLTPGVPATLAYTGTHGLRTQLDFGADAVTQTTTLVFTPTLLADGAGLAFAGHAFDLAAFRGGDQLPGLSFGAPVSVTIQYTDTDIQLINDESALALQPDGKLIAGGRAMAVDGKHLLGLARYLGDTQPAP